MTLQSYSQWLPNYGCSDSAEVQLSKKTLSQPFILFKNHHPRVAFTSREYFYALDLLVSQIRPIKMRKAAALILFPSHVALNLP